MTVAELIEKLKTLPQDAKVVVAEAPNDAYIREATDVYVRPESGRNSDWAATRRLVGCVEIAGWEGGDI